MREIKFRAWYPGYKATSGNETSIPPMMCDVVRFEKTSDNYDTYVLDSYKQTGCSRFAVPVYRVESDEQQSIIMQYTGHKDKNGNEIYEGDILKCHDKLHGKYFVGVVKMQDGCWSIDLSHLPDGHKPFHPAIGWNRDSDYLKMYHPVLGNSTEIIGNVYENPEMIVR